MRLWRARALTSAPVAIAPLLVLVLERRWGFTLLDGLDGDRRAALYQTVAGIAGALLGLGLAAFSVLFAVSSRSRLGAVIAHAGDRLRWFITTTLATLGVASAGFALAIAIDGVSEPNAMRFVVVALGVALAEAMGALVWIAHQLLAVLSLDARRARDHYSGQTAADVDDWQPSTFRDADFDRPAIRPLQPETVTPRQ